MIRAALADGAHRSSEALIASRTASDGRRSFSFRKLAFALVPLATSLVLVELGSALLERTLPAKPRVVFDFNAGAYVRQRDLALGDWFVIDQASQVQSNPAIIQRGMHELDFPLAKAPTETRLFALGGSTTQGEPWIHLERGFPERLEHLLRERHPDRRWRVLNAGVAGLDAGSLPEMTAEILALQPDGLVIYTGNNELRGGLVRACTNPARLGLDRTLNQLASVRMGRRAWRSASGRGEPMGVEQLIVHQNECMSAPIDALERTWQQGEGEPAPQRAQARDDALYREALHSFHASLEQVLDMAEQAAVPVWIAIPPLNYQKAPSRSLFLKKLDEHQRTDLVTALARAVELAGTGSQADAKDALDDILELDPTHARASFLRGMIALEDGDSEQAKDLLQAAADWDYSGGRVTSHMRQTIEQLCEDHSGAVCVDVHGAFLDRAAAGLPGPDLFVDFCHPTYELGTQIIAESFADLIAPSAPLPTEAADTPSSTARTP